MRRVVFISVLVAVVQHAHQRQALGVQLAGPAYYFGAYYDKPTIGDALRPIEPEDILRADRMMYTESVLALIIGLAVRFALMM